MIYANLCAVLNNDNVIEQNICNFIGSLKNIEEVSFNVARIILNAMDTRYKNEEHIINMIRTIANQDLDSFGGVATYSFYLFTMDYLNDMLKQKPSNNETYEMIKSIDGEVKIGKSTLDMYLSRKITKGPYVQQLFKTKNTMGISNRFHDTLHDFLTPNKSDIVKFIIDVYAARSM